MEKSTIQLSSTETYLINLDSAVSRLDKSTKVLDRVNQPFTRFSAIKHDVGVIGCGLSHLALLQKIKPTSLILEDDIETTDQFKETLEVPEDCDAIYLGVSNHGYVRRHPFGIRGVVLASKYSEDYLRVFNMCSTHAILYTSERYINACIDIINKCLSDGVAFDVGLASIHRHFNILTPHSPWFYQSEQASFTNFSLEV